MDRNGFNVFLTGGSNGMSFEMAMALLSRGATVVIAARGGPELDRTRNRLSTEGRSVYALQMDVRDENAVTEAATWFRARFDRLDPLVNNAGIGSDAAGMAGMEHYYLVYLHFG